MSMLKAASGGFFPDLFAISLSWLATSLKMKKINKIMETAKPAPPSSEKVSFDNFLDEQSE